MRTFLLTIAFFTISSLLVSCERGKDDPEPEPVYQGVTINGVNWSEFNVNTPTTFTTAVESYGMLYQWNRKTAWAATGDVTGWDNSASNGDRWETANDPCPAGWRVPTEIELNTLLDGEKVTKNWTTENGVNGYVFIDLNTDASIFFPAVGYRLGDAGTLEYSGDGGFYWMNSSDLFDGAHALNFFRNGAGWYGNYRESGFAVRCVRLDEGQIIS